MKIDFGQTMGTEKTSFSRRKAMGFPPQRIKERAIMSNKNNNQINVPQAREAMDKFKMQAASDKGVPSTY
jgi:hypothetical protein